MIKKTITYTDYNGETRTEDFWFHLSQAELLRMEFGYGGGLQNYLEKIIYENNTKKIYEMFEELVTMSYGEKSYDGKHFMKSKELSEAFTHTEAYSALIVELLSDADLAAKWVNGLQQAGQAQPKILDRIDIPATIDGASGTSTT